MTDKKDAFDGLLKFTASVSAKYIPILSAFCADIEFEKARGIFIEPADEGVILVATNGHALCAFHDAKGQSGGPVRFLLPPRIVDACRKPVIQPLYDANHDDWQASPPAWMVPGQLFLHTVGCYVYPEEQPTHLYGWNAEMGAHFASAMIETGNVWRETDYRVLGEQYMDWRKAFEGERKHATSPISLNIKTQSLFAGLGDLSDGGELLTYEVGGPNDAVIVRSKAVPEFIGAIMPTRVICDAPLPAWVRSAVATPTA
jgi:hypothetical protein